MVAVNNRQALLKGYRVLETHTDYSTLGLVGMRDALVNQNGTFSSLTVCAGAAGAGRW